MSDVPERIKKQRACYTAKAEEADRMAEEAQDPAVKLGWQNIAKSYRMMAKELTVGRW